MKREKKALLPFVSLSILSPTPTCWVPFTDMHSTLHRNIHKLWVGVKHYCGVAPTVYLFAHVNNNSKAKAMVNGRTIRHSHWCAAELHAPLTVSHQLYPDYMLCIYWTAAGKVTVFSFSTFLHSAPAAQSSHSTPARAACCFYSVISSRAWHVEYIPLAVVEEIFNQLNY